ncbi:MAG: enoyl-CoA hydratase-related protein [Bacteroidia bacterium]
MNLIESQINNNVLILKLNRPDKFNSFNRPMALELIEKLNEANTNKAVRAVLLTGNGKAFCAGQDLAEAMDANGPGIKTIVEEHYNPIILKIRELKKPVIAVVNGVAAGAGANIAIACDIVLASENASFIQAFSKIGLVPDSGGTYFLPRVVGFNLASALMITGDKLTVEDAQKFGIVYKIFNSENLLEEAVKFCETIAQMPTATIAQTKHLLNNSYSNTLHQQLQQEGKEQVTSAKSYDYNEGVNAFLEKRKPSFKGE